MITFCYQVRQEMWKPGRKNREETLYRSTALRNFLLLHILQNKPQGNLIALHLSRAGYTPKHASLGKGRLIHADKVRVVVFRGKYNTAEFMGSGSQSPLVSSLISYSNFLNSISSYLMPSS
jgi:hypothetical protein